MVSSKEKESAHKFKNEKKKDMDNVLEQVNLDQMNTNQMIINQDRFNRLTEIREEIKQLDE